MKKSIRKIVQKITLFDLILAGLVLFGITFFAVVFFRKATFVNITVKVNSDTVMYQTWNYENRTYDWFAQLFRVGMKEKDSLGNLQAEVTGVRSYDIRPSRKDVYLTLKIRGVYESSTGRYSYNGRPVLIGSTLKFNLDGVVASGLITNIDGERNVKKKVKLLVNAKVRDETSAFPDSTGIEEYMADALKVGTEVKDNNDEVIIKILDKKVTDAKRLVTTYTGETLVRSNPLRKDVELVLEVYAEENGGKYYLFDDVPIMVGERLPIITDKVSVLPFVTDFSPAVN